MKGLKAEHFLNTEPGDHLCFDKRKPKEGTKKEIAYLVHRESILGSMSQAIKRPPTKKQIVAMSDEKLSADNPVIVCPEVQPLA
jgi:hypothetical protein